MGSCYAFSERAGQYRKPRLGLVRNAKDTGVPRILQWHHNARLNLWRHKQRFDSCYNHLFDLPNVRSWVACEPHISALIAR